jgi:hypothetical protein
MLTFKTGLTILSDLNDAIYPPVKIVPQELTFKVVKAKVKSKK